MISRTIFCSAQVPTVPGNECPSFARSAPIPIKRRSGQLSLPAAQTERSCYFFFGRPRFFGGGSATRPKKVTEAVLADLVTLATEHLKKGDKIRLTGLGILQMRARPARMGCNPATGASIKIAASKKIAFRPAKELKEAV
jgi:DNA-binding protein HU-beta